MDRASSRLALPVLATILCCSCVADDRYREVLDRNETLQKANDALASENEGLRLEAEDLSLLHQHAMAQAERERDASAAAQSAFSRLSEKTQEVLGALRMSGDGVEVDFDTGRIRLADAVLFEPGQAEIRKSGEQVLKQVAEALKDAVAQGGTVRIDGHTDDQPVVVRKDVYPSNWHLSGARALNVLLFLEGQGVDPARMAFVGFGENRPREANAKGHKGNKKNRRVEIQILD